MRIGIVTDTYTPQVNGVTSVVRRIVAALHEGGHRCALVAPGYEEHTAETEAGELRVPSLPFPLYPAIRLSLPQARRITEYLDEFQPELIHVHTEGPLGLAGRRYALRRGLPLVTSFHTDFPAYSRHYGVGFLAPAAWRWLTWFHRPAHLTLTPGAAIRSELVRRGIAHAAVWGRGVETALFHPGHRDPSWRRWLAGGDDTAVQVLKRSVARPRPCDADGRPLALVDLPDPFSFPSGHAAAATAVAATVALAQPLVAPLVLPGAALVAYSRVALKVHHVSDVLAGAALGLGGAIVASFYLLR